MKSLSTLAFPAAAFRPAPRAAHPLSDPLGRPSAAPLRQALPRGWSAEAKDLAAVLLTAVAAAAALGAAAAQITLPGPAHAAAAPHIGAAPDVPALTAGA